MNSNSIKKESMNNYKSYKIKSNDENVVFINGFKVNNLIGFLWLWVNLIGIIKSLKNDKGVFNFIPGLVSPFEVVMISYWYNAESLHSYYKSPRHKKLMSFVVKNPKALSFFNERYHPNEFGRYYNQPNGLAKSKSKEYKYQYY